MRDTGAVRVLKGHGTENDFVLLPDLDGRIGLTPELTRALCDRRAGIGADGVLRVVASEHAPEAAGQNAPFFMDYRNADGSLAEMCGNGVRVFVRYLHRAGLADGVVDVATRGGTRRTTVGGDGAITVEMGVPVFLDARPTVTVRSGAGGASGVCRAPATAPPPVTLAPATAPPMTNGAAATALLMPNPHVVVALADRAALDALDLARAPTVEPALPEGQNVEFVARVGERHLVMRVHERGVGETRSCGTGICAAVVAVTGSGGGDGDGAPWRVDVPGGSCQVRWRDDGTVTLTGPAVIVAELDLDDAWLAAVTG
ncbi:MAG: diaminopimelate epimerase [Actinomycetia bacterium]|nr:diaminopimelate epimerase [Actinomycetes bacterium]